VYWKNRYQFSSLRIRLIPLTYKYLFSIFSYFDYKWNYFLNAIQRSTEFIASNSGKVGVHIVYINLDKRIDRRRKVEKEFKRMRLGIVTRISAYELNPPGKGCTLSHKAAILSQSIESSNLLMVCEDDARFMKPLKKLNKILTEFLMDESLEVLCLGYFIEERQISYSSNFQRLNNSQSAVCYILKPHMIESFLKVCDTSLSRYEANPNDPNAAIDQVWKKLQSEAVFVAPHSPYVTQRPSYSDIARGFARYPSYFKSK
jgi:hypothetical protein